MIKLSVIIVTWNSERFIADCLNSLEGLRSMSTELLLVDNASTDATVRIVREDFPWVRLIASEKNLGFAKANNIGIEATSGEYVCLVNPDVIVLEDCIERMLRSMEENLTVGMMGPRMVGPNGIVQRSCMRFPSLWNCLCDALALNLLFPKSATFGGQMMRDCSWDQVQDVDVLNGWFWLIRRTALNKIGLLDEGFFMYGEDMDWCKRFRQVGWRLVYNPFARAIHYGGGSSEHAPLRFYIEMQRANLRYWKKHKRLSAQVVFRLVMALHHSLRVAGYGVLYMISQARRPEAVAKVKRSAASLRWLMTLAPGEMAR